MNAKIFSRTGEFAGTDFDIAEEAIIGRAPSSTIVLPGVVISQRHARIAFDAGIRRYVLEDLGSLNGTALDNVPVTRPTRLGDLHVITFAGVHDFIFRADNALEALSASDRSARTAPEAAAPARPDPGPETAWVAPPFYGGVPVPAEQSQPAEVPEEDRTLHTIQSPFTSLEIPAALRPMETSRSTATTVPWVGAAAAPTPAAKVVFDVVSQTGSSTFTLANGRHVLGRRRTCDMVVADQTVSREHAAIVVEDGRASITDLGSDNGTFIGDVRVSGATDVRHGTEINLGFYVKLIRRS